MNKYVIVGWLGGHAVLFEFTNMEEGRRVAAELKSSKVWRSAWAGSVIDLINRLEPPDEGTGGPAGYEIHGYGGGYGRYSALAKTRGEMYAKVDEALAAGRTEVTIRKEK